MSNPNDISTYMGLAQDAANRSKATRLKVGAVIVNPDGVMAFGYNGTPAGWDNTCERDDVTLPEVLHAEPNAIFKFVQSGISTRGCRLFITHAPCLPCAKIIHLARIEEVVFGAYYRCTEGIEFLRKSGIKVTQNA